MYYLSFETILGSMYICEDEAYIIQVGFGKKPPFEATQCNSPLLFQAHTQLSEYLNGNRVAFDLPFKVTGTSFEQDVWRQLLSIPYGQTITYSELARRVGRPNAARAVGAACGKNPIAIFVPCHRVVGQGGHLTGYAWGKERKAALLALEGKTGE